MSSGWIPASLSRSSKAPSCVTTPTSNLRSLEGPGTAPVNSNQAMSAPAFSAEASPKAPPSGTLTFLFTDIEGSSALWEQAGEAMRAALARHDALLREAIDAHGGFVFSTGGDGFAAAFARAGEAVGAAIEGQRALQHEPWPSR